MVKSLQNTNVVLIAERISRTHDTPRRSASTSARPKDQAEADDCIPPRHPLNYFSLVARSEDKTLAISRSVCWFCSTTLAAKHWREPLRLSTNVKSSTQKLCSSYWNNKRVRVSANHCSP